MEIEEIDREYPEELSQIPDDITQISNEIAKVESENKEKSKKQSLIPGSTLIPSGTRSTIGKNLERNFQCDHCEYSTHRLANLKW